MIKVLGYNNSEVGKLYIVSTSIVVILSIILSLPICKAILGLLYRSMMFKFTGWISYSIESNVYIWMIIFGIASYLVVALLEMYKIKKIPMRDALKTSE